MKKILQLSYRKTLKLTNALICVIQKEDIEHLETFVQNIDNFIKVKGGQPIGPLIQYTNSSINEYGKLDMDIKMIRQSSNFINHVADDYSMKSIIRIPNCMYCRYIGPEGNLKFAYDKIMLTAFEEDIPLKGDSYTIFVDNNEGEDYIIADVFMEREDEWVSK